MFFFLTNSHRNFSSKAMEDIERFQSQKVIDLKESLTAYCVLQYKLNRKVLFFKLFTHFIVNFKVIFQANENYLFVGSSNVATYQRVLGGNAISTLL